MLFSLPFAFPLLANRTFLPSAEQAERQGIVGLLLSTVISVAVGGFLVVIGRQVKASTLFRKEAMAIVGLSWVLATVLGALPYYLSETQVAPGQPITLIEAMF